LLGLLNRTFPPGSDTEGSSTIFHSALTAHQFFDSARCAGNINQPPSLIGLTNYMFDASIPRCIRGLSLFQALPVLLVWMLHRLGYDHRAWLWQTIVAAVVLPRATTSTGFTDSANSSKQ
jgi:hypothetical protein